MSYLELKRQAFEANMELNARGLVIYTWGNVSQLDRDAGVMAIKPSGVPYEELKPEHMVIVDMDNKIVEGSMRPSSDTKTHTHLYRHFDDIGGVTHTHSTYATAWAQAQTPIPCYGTTHADFVYGEVPCTAAMTDAQVERDYEEETGVQITDRFANLKPLEVPMVIVAGHAPFTWGVNAEKAVYHAVVLEELAKMASLTLEVNQRAPLLSQAVLNKHYNRKHGKNAYYGQK
ncbi:L-ribulose-5-phosphate 4-epimerase [Saccharobesus litoralis]|uniref:L-ribulose-5-phosphate 4-epimerase n=1 Tax=Saccharobesus litoralis TaxID=2172099 RepID=A0A2S0VPZ5_9ALTE|nr:L-ribulose-5-phosphate 4-epimerase [Saccharobesus litoralis]AWB66291.1 L-ribulose-5-phosphate 4-epimerase [Saccharobesus litoralis]